MNQNGALDRGDVIDGFDDVQSGAYIVRDPTLPGPLAVTEVIYSGGAWLGQDLYYPTNIASMGQLPLIVVSHGNGHNYQWYDHIGNHMASYGYIVMSHENETGPGIETASTTTLTNTDYIINNQATIDGGALNGHIDTSLITWIGHSRGGEGVTRAYDRIFDGTFIPTSGYGLADIQLVSSIAPVDFLGHDSSAVHGGRTTTCGPVARMRTSTAAPIATSARRSSCSTGPRARASRSPCTGSAMGTSTTAPGAAWPSGRASSGRPDTHTIMRGYLLPMGQALRRGQRPRSRLPVAAVGELPAPGARPRPIASTST